MHDYVSHRLGMEKTLNVKENGLIYLIFFFKVLGGDLMSKSFRRPGRLAHCHSRGSPNSPTSGIRALIRLGGERDPSVDHASNVGDTHLRKRLLGFKCVIMSHIN